MNSATKINSEFKIWDNQPEYSLDPNKQYGTLTVAEYKRLKSIENLHDELVEALINLYARFKDTDDRGPMGEQWQSEELIRDLKLAKEVLKKAESL